MASAWVSGGSGSRVGGVSLGSPHAMTNDAAISKPIKACLSARAEKHRKTCVIPAKAGIHVKPTSTPSRHRPSGWTFRPLKRRLSPE